MTASRELTGQVDRVRVEIGSGRVELLPTEDEQTHARIEVDHGEAEDVRFTVEDGELRVETPKNTRRGPEVTVTIRTPATLDARIKTGSGDVEALVPLGQARVSSGSGDLRLDRVEGTLAANTGSGDIQVRSATGPVRANTGSGEIDLGDTAAQVALSTGSGDVRISDAAGPVTVKVGSGDITIERIRDHSVATSGSGDVRVERADGPSVRAETARGNVQIGVPDGVPAYLDLKTVTGRIRSDLVPGPEPEPDQQSVLVRARTVSGDITVVRA